MRLSTLTLVLILSQTVAWAQTTTTPSEVRSRKIPAADLLSDFRLMKRAYTELHPGMIRYQTTDELAENFSTLESFLSADRTIAAAFLAYSRFLAAIKCGHTYTNFYNQPEAIKAGLFDNANKLPFTFDWIEGRMIATMTVDEDPRIRPGTEILSLNGTPVAAIRDSLMTVVHADGGNDAKRLKDLELTPQTAYAYFDIYYPLFFLGAVSSDAVSSDRISIEAQTADGDRFSSSVSLGTADDRRAAWETEFGPLPASVDELWKLEWLNDDTAHLYLGTFTTWHFEMNWRSFLIEAFDEIRARASHLIIDIRGNGGGLTEVSEALTWYIARQAVVVPHVRQFVAYESVPDDLRPFVRTWDSIVYSFEGKVVPTEDGRYADANPATEPRRVAANPDAFAGDVYLIVDATNSSATHGLAQVIQDNGLATLVGQETGGNLRGLNGGQMFFLDLPNTLIEMDIPIFAVYPLTEQPDRGVVPDVVVRPTIEMVATGRDPELEAVKEIIASRQR